MQSGPRRACAAGLAVLTAGLAGLLMACGGGTPPSGAEDCGRITPSGWPTTTAPSPGVLSCLQDALATGVPATLVEVSYASYGSPNAGDPAYRHEITYEVVGPGALRVTTDWTGVPGGPGGVVVEVCNGLEGSLWPVPTGCSPA